MLYQDIITYRNQKTALSAAELLLKDGNKTYEEYEAEGFEKVYVSAENLIAVIDSTLYRISIIEGDEILPSTDELLEIIKSKKLPG